MVRQMVVTSAPGKVILLGEHAVVFGQPAIAVAIDLRIRSEVHPASTFTMNDSELSGATHPYIHDAIRAQWSDGPLAVETESDLPSGSGMGSSAAVTVGVLAALRLLQRKGVDEKEIAMQAFEIESAVQGRASPIDTSVSAHGKGIVVGPRQAPDFLWHIKKDEREWFIHHCDVPRLNLVVGFTGIHAATGPLVAKVKRYADHTTFARDIIQEIGELSAEGVKRLKENDVVRLGELMTRDHKLLAILGVSCRELDKLVMAALPYSYGAKLTGAGGGGSMIALTDRTEEVCEAIRMKGGTPFVVRTGVDGVREERQGR